MSTTISDIKEWFERGVRDKKKWLIIVCDTYDWEDYPIYAFDEEEFRKKFAEHDGPNMQKVMEVYNLSKPIDKQIMKGKFAFDMPNV